MHELSRHSPLLYYHGCLQARRPGVYQKCMCKRGRAAPPDILIPLQRAYMYGKRLNESERVFFTKSRRQSTRAMSSVPDPHTHHKGRELFRGESDWIHHTTADGIRQEAAGGQASLR